MGGTAPLQARGFPKHVPHGPLTVHDVEDVSLLHRAGKEMRPRPLGVHRHVFEWNPLSNRNTKAMTEGG